MSELINEADSKVAAAALPSTKKNPTEFLKQVLSNYYCTIEICDYCAILSLMQRTKILIMNLVPGYWEICGCSPELWCYV